MGNKTKRGAELEGTPKTPRSFEVSPCKPTCVDSFSQEPEDRRLIQLRSRRPLQWNNLAKQVTNAMGVGSTPEDSLENTLSPFLDQDMTSSGESNVITALSPICVNAVRGNSHQQGMRFKAAMKKLNEMPPSLAFPKIKDFEAALKEKSHSRALEDAHWTPREEHGAAGPIDADSCLTGERIFFWSNAAFNQRPAHEETICTSKEASSSTSCSLSGLSAHYKASERADCEAESKDPLANCCQRESLIVDSTADAIGSSGPEDQETKLRSSRGQCTELSDSSLARKLLFTSDKSSLCGSVLEPDYSAFPQRRSEAKECTDLQRSIVRAGQAQAANNEGLESGLDEIEQEIQRLTERLMELQFQKRTREKEIKRHREGRKEAADRERSVIATLQQRQGNRSAVTGAKKGKGAVSISSSSASVLRSPRGNSLGFYPEGTPVNRRAQCPATASASKLSELRKSVSSASCRRMKSSNRSSDSEADCSKVLRRLSMSGPIMSSPSNVLGQQQQRSLSGKGGCTPSRVVSSRYGRAITPDACRTSGGSTLASCKKRHHHSAASSLLLQPPASVANSPLKKGATLRSGYPSRSGFATPTKERQQVKPVSSIIAASNTASSSSSLRAQNLGRLLHSPRKTPITRIDSPKSTAALYQCLESLLEDSKHFFKRLSPARSHLLHNHHLSQQLVSSAHATAATCKSLELILPSINTCRVDAISPRDSGCVKRACDRRKSHFFAMQEPVPHALES